MNWFNSINSERHIGNESVDDLDSLRNEVEINQPSPKSDLVQHTYHHGNARVHNQSKPHREHDRAQHRNHRNHHHHPDNSHHHQQSNPLKYQNQHHTKPMQHYDDMVRLNLSIPFL